MNLEIRKSAAFDQLHSLKNILNNHGVIAYPTETVFGFGCDPFDDSALEKIFKIKGRENNKGLLVLIPSRSEISKFASHVPLYAEELISKYWPSGVTLIFKANENLSPLLIGSEKSIGLRITSHKIASFLTSLLQFGIVSTSANKSGEAPYTSAKEVRDRFGDSVDFVVEGKTDGTISSTVVDCRGEFPLLIRRGIVEIPEIINRDRLN